MMRVQRCSVAVIETNEAVDTYTHITASSVSLLKSFTAYLIIHCDSKSLRTHFSSKSGNIINPVIIILIILISFK